MLNCLAGSVTVGIEDHSFVICNTGGSYTPEFLRANTGNRGQYQKKYKRKLHFHNSHLRRDQKLVADSAF